MRPIRLWIGAALVVLGVLAVLDATGVLESTGVVERWWPIAVIGTGVLGMVLRRRLTLGMLVITAIGFALLADAQDWTTEDVLGPALLVIIGLAVLAPFWSRGRTTASDTEGESPFALFGAAKVKDHSEHLQHAEASALFGGATLDLREAHIEDEATVEATAIFGGVDVLVPRDVRVSLGGLPIFGGLEDKTTGDGELPEDAPHLNVRAMAIFGGVDVAHEPD
ncbi:MAG TPA: LiaF domain-containing protein [Actinomycetota bacterium]